jgi:eukaryotic-like serine/threonine-protein kinase
VTASPRGPRPEGHVSELPRPGDVLGGFRVEERLHAGGMGVIYRVSGPEAGFPLLMKVPRLGHGEPGEAVVTYEVERTLLAALRGPHVPRFVAAGDVASQPYLVMERVEGRSLAEWADRAPLPPDEVARLGGAVATAVHALHQQEAIHLDLKPSNVLFRPSGEAVLIDLGLAAHAHYPDLLAEELRRPAGSPPYLSPEQVLGVRSDPRSDLFALGVILYELATGRLPFGAPITAAGLRKRLFRDPVPPRALQAGVPPWLQEIVLRCLEPDARARYASAAQVAFDLAHPDQVALTERAERLRRRAGLRAFLRWVRAAGLEPAPPSRPSAHLSTAPIILAAVATSHGNEAQFEALREVSARLLAQRGETRLACVTVVRPAPELGASKLEESATRQRIKHLVLLRHWAEPLHLPPGRISFHVLEAADPAAALVDYARLNHVDHVVIGAPPPDVPFQRLLGTIPTKVALRAPCTVSVVRPRGGR